MKKEFTVRAESIDEAIAILQKAKDNKLLSQLIESDDKPHCVMTQGLRVDISPKIP